MSILATKSGWLIVGKIVKETKTFFYFEPLDNKGKLSKVRKDNSGSNSRIFDSVDEALNWIDEDE